MPSMIYFAASRGENVLALRVEEEPQDVADALSAASRGPVALTGAGKDSPPVWVNPGTVAWVQGIGSRTGGFSFS